MFIGKDKAEIEILFRLGHELLGRLSGLHAPKDRNGITIEGHLAGLS